MATKDTAKAVVRRKPRLADVVAKRVAAHCAVDCERVREGVVKLNRGFFMLERMRSHKLVKAK